MSDLCVSVYAMDMCLNTNVHDKYRVFPVRLSNHFRYSCAQNYIVVHPSSFVFRCGVPWMGPRRILRVYIS